MPCRPDGGIAHTTTHPCCNNNQPLQQTHMNQAVRPHLPEPSRQLAKEMARCGLGNDLGLPQKLGEVAASAVFHHEKQLAMCLRRSMQSDGL